MAEPNADDAPYAEVDASRTLIAEVLVTSDGTRATARDLFGDGGVLTLSPSPPRPAPGTIVSVERATGRVLDTLALPESARAGLWAVVARLAPSPLWTPAALAEAAQAVAAPGVGDPALDDLTALPFVTIDNEDSRDLDQALYITAGRDDGAWVVYYALADASHYVRPGSALFDESLARGASYYLPGLAIPMLPRPLSEGIVSLNPDVERRAVVFVMTLGPAGACLDTRVARARVRSRAKLSYDGVQRFYDGAGDERVTGTPWEASLRALRSVGQLRIALAEANDVVQYNRVEVDVGFTDERGRHFVAVGETRNDTERYNEQISLLCNVQGARLMADRLATMEGAGDLLRAVFRVHPAPSASQLDGLTTTIDAIIAQRRLDAAVWRWRRGKGGESLAAWLDRLPKEGAARPVFLVMQRQALLTNQRSMFAAAPGLHHGVGAPVYARFSSPMREVAGIFTHHEALDAWGLAPGAERPDGEPLGGDGLHAAVIQSANRSKELQRQLTKAANKLVLDDVLAGDLAAPPAGRPVREGAVLGVSGAKLYVQLEAPPLEVKVYLDDVARSLGATVEPAGPAAVAVARGDQRVEIGLGDVVRLTVAGYDAVGGRWELLPERIARRFADGAS